MKINIIGGGPAGLYFAILMKRTLPSHDITIYERNGPDDTFGWGVVFSGKTLANLREADAESHAEITRSFEAWDNVDVVHRDQKISIHGNSFSGIARLQLLHILQQRCRDLNITVNFHTEVADAQKLAADCDLLLGGDGVNSTVRQKFADQFQPSLDVRPNKYIWYGTNRLFHGLTLTFRETPAGVFAAHSYKFNKTTSTFIIECDEPTWTNAGFANMPEEETRAYLAGAFAPDLNGHPLLSNNSKWINFLLVKNAQWSYENIVLLGDALHTAHFSIGSGTKLALEDAIALKQCFDETSDVGSALRRFAEVRRPVIEEYQAAAYDSMVWFENARRYMHLSPTELAYVLMTRSGKVDHESLRKRDPEFVAHYERERKANCFRAGTKVKTKEGWKGIETIRRGELVWSQAESLQLVVGVQVRPHVGRLIGLRFSGSADAVWVTPEQEFLAPSPLAERGLGGEAGDDRNPTPLTPSPQAGRGRSAEIHRRLGGFKPGIADLARRLRIDSTSAEKVLWECLRGRRLCGSKFRRQHPLGPHYIADFYCPPASLAIELDGGVHDSRRARWADGIRHRQIAIAGVKVLRFANDRVFDDLENVLLEIAQYVTGSLAVMSESRSPRGRIWRAADTFLAGDPIVIDEKGRVDRLESVERVVADEPVYDLTLERNQPFITEAGVVRSTGHDREY